MSSAANLIGEDDHACFDQALLASLVALSNDAITSIDRDGKITSWNKAAEQLYGYGADEIIGSHISLFLPSDRAWEEAALLDRVWSGETVAKHQSQRRGKGGEIVDISATLTPIRDGNRIVGSYNIIKNMTPEKTAQAELERLTAENRQFSRWHALVSGIDVGAQSEQLAQGRLLTLSVREREVFLHIVTGCTSKGTGRSLGISPRTVEIHRANILRKLNAKRVFDLVRIAVSAGLL